jgi:nucleoside-diphosphate-sugar epimerase
VGRELAARAAAAGAAVTALTRTSGSADALRASGIETVAGDLTGSGWHGAVRPGADAVVICVSGGDSSPEGYRRTYVEGIRSVLAWVARGPAPVGTMVYTSSTGVYPQGGGVVVDETAATDEASPTGKVLVEAEELLRSAPPVAVTRSFILRLAGIYGPGRHSLLDRLRAGATTINGRGGHRLNLVHRDDAVSAILACLAAEPGRTGGTFNVSDGHPAAKSEVVNWLAERLGRAAPVFDETGPSLRRGGAGIPDRIISPAAIRQQLGWRPVHPDYRSGYTAILGQV